VSNENGIQRTRIEWRLLPVAFAQFLQPLKHSAIDQDACFVCDNEVLRSRDRAHPTPKLNTRQ
jgi:hypothetical protein